MAESGRTSIDEALARYLDGETEPDDGELLAEAMRADGRFADEVRRLLMIDDLLRQDALQDGRAFQESVAMRLSADRDGGEFLERFKQRVRHGGPSVPPRWPWLPWVVAAAACIVAVSSLGLGLGLRSGARRDRPEIAGRDRDAAQPRAASKRQAAGAEAVVALLVDEAGAQFAGDAAPRSVRFAAGAYQLTGGTVHLRFTSGADVVIHAPARYVIHDPLRMALEDGILRAVVPDSAHGFTVEAPGVVYVDLGTEFGVAVAAARAESELHVFEGRVDLRSPGGERIARVRLGESVRVVGGVVEPKEPADLDRFPTPGAIGFQRWNRGQETSWTDPSLVCYYPFLEDPEDDRLLRDHATHGQALPGRIRGARWVSGRWPGKQALLFDRDEDTVELTLPGEFRQMTMAAWVNIDRLDYELNAILDSDGWGPGDFHWQLTRSGEEGAAIYGPYPEKTFQVGRSVPLGQWAHHAVVLDLDRPSIRVFVNGELIREVILPRPAPTLAPGRCRLGDWLRRTDWQHAPKRGLRGRIDEFAIWRRALSHEELRGLATAGRPSLLSAVGHASEF
jgi:hypothetical protein